MNIVEIAVGSDDFNILVQALSTAGLVETIQNSNDITVFAPTDAAFTQLAVDLGFTGDQADEDALFGFIAGALAGLDPDGDPLPLLTDILTYHVSDSVLTAADVTAATTIPTLLSGADIAPRVPVLGDLEPDLIDPALVTPDIAADNGIIHSIDRVLLPIDIPGNDAASITGIVAASGDLDDNPADFDILLAAVQTAGLAETLATDGLDVTVFAPDDGAFLSLAQTLGFTGTDEAGALGFIVATLTELGGGDPIPLLTAILTYHVSPGAKQLAEVAGLDEVATLQGGTIGIDGTTLVDNEPDLADPSLKATDIQASNGIVHVIDEVLLPVNIPASNGANDVKILIGTEGRDRLQGGDDNDLIIDGVSGDLLIGGGGADIFALAGDGTRNKIIDFEEGVDTIDISAWGTTSFDDLVVRQRGEGSLLVGSGDNSVVVQAADRQIDVADLSTDSFIFAEVTGPNFITGTDARDRITGTDADDVIDGGLGRDFIAGGAGADIFVAGADAFDVILDFTENRDQVDISAWGVGGFDELSFTQLRPGLVTVEGGAGSVRIKAADRQISEADFDADDFIF